MLIDFYIIDADCLIHYDIPADKHKFSLRFSFLQNSNNVLKVSLLNYIVFNLIKKNIIYIYILSNTKILHIKINNSNNFV
jgi:hypothetical protein